MGSPCPTRGSRDGLGAQPSSWVSVYLLYIKSQRSWQNLGRIAATKLLSCITGTYRYIEKRFATLEEGQLQKQIQQHTDAFVAPRNQHQNSSANVTCRGFQNWSLSLFSKMLASRTESCSILVATKLPTKFPSLTVFCYWINWVSFSHAPISNVCQQFFVTKGPRRGGDVVPHLHP